MNSPSSQFSSKLLMAGAVLGLVLASSGLFESVDAPVNDDIIAEVNEWTISRGDYEQLLSALQADKREPINNVDRQHILDRMIEEKLLLQRGLELGLIETEPSVRKAISNAMIQAVVAEVSALAPNEDDIESFFADNKAYFSRPARLRVRQLLFRDGDDPKLAYQRAQQAYEALADGKPLDEVLRQYADQAIVDVPDSLLPPHKLRDYIGPALLDVALELQAGQISTPQRGQNAYVILIVLDKELQADLKLEQVREQVIAEYQRRAGDQALRDYLDRLRAESDIRIADDLLRSE